jgi:hypothetical protein
MIMSDETLDETLERVPEQRRARLRKLAVAAAFTMPMVGIVPGCFGGPQVPTPVPSVQT